MNTLVSTSYTGPTSRCTAVPYSKSPLFDIATILTTDSLVLAIDIGLLIYHYPAATMHVLVTNTIEIGRHDPSMVAMSDDTTVSAYMLQSPEQTVI